MVSIKHLEHKKFPPKVSTPEQRKCSLFPFQAGIKTPIYCLGSQSLVGKTPFGGIANVFEEEQSILDALFLAQWDERMSKGCFRYDVTTSEIKVISGRGKFVAQLNEEWSMDYPSKSEDNEVCHQRDSSIFHCMDRQEELLFCVASSEKANSELIPLAAVPSDAMLIIINENPIEYGHVFLVYSGSNGLYLDVTSIEMILRVAVETNNYSFRLFYDCASPGASHMCFQACYFPDHLPVELMPVDTFFSDRQSGIRISAVIDYPIKTLLFEHNYNTKIMAEVICKICSCLQEKNIPYNLLVSSYGKSIFLFLQKLATSGNLSAYECSGYFLFKSKNEFDQVTEDAIRKSLSAVSLDDECFQAVKQLCSIIGSKLGV